eukprot:295093-Amphidinium_carterae.1
MTVDLKLVDLRSHWKVCDLQQDGITTIFYSDLLRGGVGALCHLRCLCCFCWQALNCHLESSRLSRLGTCRKMGYPTHHAAKPG